MSLNAIIRSPITGEWTEDAGVVASAKLTLPYGCEHSIDITSIESRRGLVRAVMTSDLFVPEEYRRNGIATRLLKAGLALAKSEGVGLSMSHIESPFALMARLSIFGEKGLTLCDDDKNATPVDLTFDEALTMLERDEREYGFVVESNLNDIDTSDWELPIMKTKPV